MVKDTPQTGSQRDRKSKELLRRELMAKFLYDVAKLLIAGTVIAAIPQWMQGEFTMSSFIATGLGLVSVLSTVWAANRMLVY